MLVLILIIPILFFLLLEAFFSGSETAIMSSNKMRLRAMADRGNNRAIHLNNLLKLPGRLLGTTLVGTNISVAVSTTLASILVAFFLKSRYAIDSTDIESLLTTIIMIPFILIFGEIIPKSVCRAKANTLSLTFSPFLRAASIALYPVAFPIAKLSGYFALLFSYKERQRKFRVADELRLLAQISEKEGSIKPHQRKMIDRVFDLERQRVGQVMVPLVDVVSIDSDSGLEEFYEKISESEFSRFPVYKDRVDNIIGIVNVLDALYSNETTDKIRPFVKEDILYFPESKHITTALSELQRSKYPMAIVVDEYGGVVGIVTTKDLAEEIVGEIKQEWVKEEKGFDDLKLECDGKTEIDEINERLGTDIPKEGYETIAGFLISRMDRIPKIGDIVMWKDLQIKVINADNRSVLRVKFLFIEGNKEDEKAETGHTQG